MAKLAFMNIGVLREPFGHAQVRGFVERISDVFGAAEGSQGFIELFGNPPDVPPTFRAPEFAGRVAHALSVWRDLESVMAYAYGGLHAEALAKRKDWFEHGPWPGYVAWWVSEGEVLSWDEALRRFERLCADGSTPQAFTFKQAFSPDGAPYAVDRDAIKAIALENQTRVLVREYLGAWNEPDDERRLGLLEKVFAESGCYTDPTAHVEGRAALDAHIAGFQRANPGARFTVEDEIDHHHAHLRFYWSLRLANGVEVSGMDYAERSSDARLQRIVGFF
jgi:hypothetical protein